ncbi:MAG: phospholipid carrier-dependent glycosyltransferase, partial [Akkermansiaceae bacterium]|nr:phospholipid carrier-dependent glycosyltransferase [Akkermansiaceae bacterium]
MTKCALIIACWITVIATGAFLRFDHLSQRPFHADEATGARITSTGMELGEYRFDPVHYHGPILSKLSATICNMNGETHWRELTKSSLRFLTAISGCLLILVPLLWRKRFGDVPMLLTAALFATSPLLVYYSRMFIHESLLVLFGMLALVSLI